MKLNRFQIAACKRTAQNIKKFVAKRDKINAEMQRLAGELIETNNQIDAWEEPIKVMTGGYTSEQILAWNGEIPEAREAVSHSDDLPFNNE